MNTTAQIVLALVLASMAASAQQSSVRPPATPPPAAPVQRSAKELENLVARIALYPDPLIATILPAAVYPLEIVQAARFVADTNNLPNLQAQPWDDNVKAVASVPAVITMMNDDLAWTIALGEMFLSQDKDLLDAIQRLRGKAQNAGTLRSTPQQTVVVATNRVIMTTVERQTVVVTNMVVQIQPVNPDVVYVPTYNPAYVYYPPPTYVYDPYAPLVAFGAAVAVGAIIANNCDWHGGGVYVGHHGTVVWSNGGYHHGDVDIDRNVNVNNQNVNVNRGDRGGQTASNNRPGTGGSQQKWKPDQNRLSSTSTLGNKGAASTMESRGWSSSGGARPSTQPGSAARAQPSTGNVATRPSTGSVATRPSTGGTATRPTASPSVSRPASSSGSLSARPSSTSGGSAFGGVSSGSGTRSYSSRGSSSRSGGSRGGGGRGGRR